MTRIVLISSLTKEKEAVLAANAVQLQELRDLKATIGTLVQEKAALQQALIILKQGNETVISIAS